MNRSTSIFNSNRIVSDIFEDVKRKFDRIDYIHAQNFSINGVGIYKGQKCFFKIVDHEFFIKEINGYLMVYKEIPTMKILFVKYLYQSKRYLIAYEFDKTITDNQGLLNDLFAKNDFKINISKIDSNKMESVLKEYEKIYDSSLKYLNYYPSRIFFEERVDTRLKKWYLDDLDFSKLIINIENDRFSINDILKETKNYFYKNKDKLYQCSLTQGDPNTLNISTRPCFFDLATAGYNPIVAEVAMTVIATLIYDNYFCPKYHEDSFYLHDLVVKQYLKFEPKISIEKSENSVVIDSNIVTSKIRKQYILKYISIIRKNNIKITDEIKYFIIMRLLCIFDIRKMSYNDFYYSLYLVCFFYKNISKNFYISIENILNEMESV